MPDDAEPLDADPRRSRRPLVLGAIAAVCLLAVAAAGFALVRSDGGDDSGDAVTEVTFDDAGNATSIPERPANYGPIMALSVDSGLAGTEVTLQGASFNPAHRVDLYWNRVDGPKLGTVDAPRFSVKVKIPEDAPVVNEGHFIIAVQRNKDGKVVTQQSAQFYVLPPR